MNEEEFKKYLMVLKEHDDSRANSNYMSDFEDQQPKAAVNTEEEVSKWEIDVRPIFDDLFHELLGETYDSSTGNWERDEYKTRRMNERGASVVVSELKTRVDRITILSELDKDLISETCMEVGLTFTDMIVDNFPEWEIRPLESEFESICNIIVHKLEFSLKTAQDGGMKKHRELSKFPNPIPYSNNYNYQQGGM